MTQFSIEYVLRIWSAGCRGRYEGIRGFGFNAATAIWTKISNRKFEPEVLKRKVDLLNSIQGRLRYALEFFPLLDLVVVTAGIILFIFGWSDSRGLSASSALRSLRSVFEYSNWPWKCHDNILNLRFLQIIRMVRLDKNGSSWKLLGSVIYAHSKELITGTFFTIYIFWEVNYPCTFQVFRVVGTRNLMLSDDLIILQS